MMSISNQLVGVVHNLGMPQMLCGAISERWLFKEAGDLHWRMLTADLGTPSNELADESGERLYASFIRIRMESTVPLTSFEENETLAVSGELSRFGDKRLFSQIAFEGKNGAIKFELATVFVTRATSNKSLSRATPQQLGRAKSKELSDVPTFGQGYQRVKRLALDGTPPTEAPLLELARQPFDWTENASDTVSYVVNPFYDFNGASLLYFASYPRIHDVCEREIFGPRLERAGRRGAAADSAFVLAPVARDIYYFGNADAGDELTFRLRKLEAEGRRLKIWSTISRAKDGARIADVFAIKEGADGVAEILRRS